MNYLNREEIRENIDEFMMYGIVRNYSFDDDYRDVKEVVVEEDDTYVQ